MPPERGEGRRRASLLFGAREDDRAGLDEGEERAEVVALGSVREASEQHLPGLRVEDRDAEGDGRVERGVGGGGVGGVGGLREGE